MARCCVFYGCYNLYTFCQRETETDRDRERSWTRDRQTDRETETERETERERETEAERASMRLYQSGQNPNLTDSYICATVHFICFGLLSRVAGHGMKAGGSVLSITIRLMIYILTAVLSPERCWRGPRSLEVGGGGVEGWGRETKPDVHYHHHDDSSRAAMARGCPRGCVHNPQLWKREESHSDDSFMVRGRPRGCVHSSQLLKREESHFNVKDYPQGLSTPFEEREPF